MTLAYLGAICWDETVSLGGTWAPEAIATTPLVNQSGIVQPTALETTMFSRFRDQTSMKSGGGGNGSAIFTTRSKDFVWYLFNIQLNGTSTLGMKTRHLYSDPSGPAIPSGAPATGCVAWASERVVSPSFVLAWKFRFCWFDGAVWQEGPLTTNGYTTIGTAGVHITMEIQISTGNCKMWVNGTADTGADVTTGVTPVANTPTVAGVTYATGGFITTGSNDEIIMAEGDASGDRPSPYTSAATGLHCFAYYPKTIGDSNSWSVVNACDPSEKWRAVRDPMKSQPFYSVNGAVDPINDYIQVTGDGSNIDQLFGIDFVAAAWPSASILGVYLAVGTPISNPTIVKATSLLLKQGGTTVVQAGNGPDATGGWKYHFAQLAPDGGAWSAAKLEALQVGVRNSTNLSAQRASIFVVGVVGTNIGRPQYPFDCFIGPPVGAQII